MLANNYLFLSCPSSDDHTSLLNSLYVEYLLALFDLSQNHLDQSLAEKVSRQINSLPSPVYLSSIVGDIHRSLIEKDKKNTARHWKKYSDGLGDQRPASKSSPEFIWEVHREKQEKFITKFQEGYCLLSENPLYLNWFLQVVHTINVTSAPSDGFSSGSNKYGYGHIFMSENAEVLDIVETMVHESAHQYFFLAWLLDPLVENEDESFYSPLKNQLRPAKMIVLSWHALANILLAISSIDKYKGSEGKSRIEKYKAQFDPLTDIVLNKIRLTQFGEVFVDNLLRKHRPSVFNQAASKDNLPSS